MNALSHLGGHCGITHIDQGAIWVLKAMFQPKSFLDIGCGKGGLKRLIQGESMNWTGVDGDPSCASESIIIHDFIKGKMSGELIADIVWSVEFVEHVDELYLDNVLDALCRAQKAICMTHALPGKKGYHHVNCQSSEYWINHLSSKGFHLHELATKYVRSFSSMKREFMRNTGMVFTRK